jgi:signal transduction histidine kinase
VAARLKENPELQIDLELLGILLNNLFSNAINHNIPHGYIGVVVQSGRLIVSNTGDAIPFK